MKQSFQQLADYSTRELIELVMALTEKVEELETKLQEK
jgi:hypothetical protein